MGVASRDLIAVVERCYDLSATDEQWLQGVGDALHAVVRPEESLIGYHIDRIAGGFAFRDPIQSGPSTLDMLARIRAMGELLDAKRSRRLGILDHAKAAMYEHVIRSGLAEPADKMLDSEFRRVGPDWMYRLGTPVKDTFALLSHHIDGNGVTAFFGGLTAKRTYRPAERAMFQMLSAHIKAGLRLRRRLPSTGAVEAPAEGAVLSGEGRVLHADGEAREAEHALREGARAIDFARSGRSGRAEDALEVWRGLISGRWSLVERFDVDGKRLLLAHRNPEEVSDPRGLTSMESRVVGLAVRGYPDKLIAYHLGVAEGTASAHLSRALLKLRIKGRVELIRELGTHYPPPPAR